jgi:hypothetical protein
MGWLTRLFGGGGTPKVASIAPIAQEPQGVNILQEMLHRGSLEAAMKIILDYADVLETLHGRLTRTGKYLEPESLLPHPKEVIHRAFALILEAMEKDDLQQWRGVPKDTYLAARTALDFYWAPDKEVPDDPKQNLLAYQRLGLDRVDVDWRIKANPDGEDRLLEAHGISKEAREHMIQAAIARAEERERQGEVRKRQP